MALAIEEQVPLAPRTTFELGGPARYFATVGREEDVAEAYGWARDRELPVFVLGGGSNVVVGDEGFPGLVVDMSGLRGISTAETDGAVEITALAGEPWDPLVAAAVEKDLAGLECLSGIPGMVGATPIQNVGAYGQEVGETIVRVRVRDLDDGRVDELPASACDFAYRDSMFKRVPDRHVVLSVTFRLTVSGAPAIRYAELERALVDEPTPSLSRVREQVIALRRAKSMVIDLSDENHRSAGSFFTNPIVSDTDAARVAALAVAEGIAKDPSEVPRYPAGDGRTKLAAGWLIERSGMAKGYRRGNVGISTRHALGLVNLGGARTEELLALAREVRTTVRDRFGVTLVPEPRLINCAL